MEEKNKKERIESVESVDKSIALENPIDLLKPIISRMRKRLTKIKELSSAVHQKIMRGNVTVWHTEAPKMFIAGLDAGIVNNIATITYQVYQKEGPNKKINIMRSKVRNSDGIEREIEVSAQYPFKELVVETIEFRKPIKIERFNSDE